MAPEQIERLFKVRTHWRPIQYKERGIDDND